MNHLDKTPRMAVNKFVEQEVNMRLKTAIDIIVKEYVKELEYRLQFKFIPKEDSQFLLEAKWLDDDELRAIEAKEQK